MATVRLSGIEEVVNNPSDPNSQSADAVGWLTGGEAVAVWDNPSGVVFRLLSPNAPVGQEIVASNFAEDGTFTALPNGNFLVGYFVPIAQAGLGEEFYQQYDPNGSKVGNAVVADEGFTTTQNGTTSTFTYKQLTSVAVMADGKIVIGDTYNVVNSGNINSQVTFAQVRFPGGGDTAASIPNGNLGDSRITPFPSGPDFVWSYQDGAGTISAAIWNENETFVTSLTVSNHPSDQNFDPEVAMLPNGQFVVAWDDATTGNIEYKIFNSNGTVFASEATANQNSGKAQGSFSITAIGGDQFAIAWTELTASSSKIEERIFSGNGTPTSNAVQINTSTANTALVENLPAISALPNGREIAIWSDNSHLAQGGQTPDTNGYAVKSQIIQVTPAPSDFNGNGLSDVLWRNSSDGSLVAWLMNGPAVSSGTYVTYQGNVVAPDSTWSVAGIGDFNSDGLADVLWRQSTTGSVVEWQMNGSQIAASNVVTSQGSPIVPDSSWSVAGIGDFNGDGDADVLWRQSTTGSLVDWSMSGPTVQTGVYLTNQGNAVAPDSTWSVAGIGDFNGDGHADILWRQSTTGSLVEWQMNGSQIASPNFVTSQGSAITPDSSWSVAGIGDFNGDGNADVLWRQSTTGALVDWSMSGPTVQTGVYLTYQGNAVAPDSTWSIVEVGNFNNSTGDASILWQQSTTGSLVEWQMNGAQIASSNFVTSQGNPIAPPSNYQVQGSPTDFV